MKVISFSLFGSNPKYNEGAIRNALLARIIYPHWQVRFYLDHSVPMCYRQQLAGIGCDIQLMIDDLPSSRRMAWRFLAATGDTVIFRDADSLLSPKEAAAVDEWDRSGKSFHMIRDHEHHYSHPLFGGLWGTKSALPFSDWIANRQHWGERMDDMLLLTEHVWPIAKDDIMQHCGAGSERMQWGEWIRLQAGEDYHLGAGVTAKW